MTHTVVSITPGSGEDVAVDDIAGVNFQRVKLVHGAEGVADNVSEAAPLPVDASFGELIEVMESLRFAVSALAKNVGAALPGAAGFPIMEVRQATAANLNVTASGTVTANQGGTWNITTLTNQSQLGGFSANDQIPALMHLQADNLRRNISVT